MKTMLHIALPCACLAALSAVLTGCASLEYRTADGGSSTSGTMTIRPSLTTTTVKAELGNAAAQNDLGLAYLKGQGVAKNPAEAVKWFAKAAEQGLASAQANLGVAYSRGLGVPKDYYTAERWMRRAADQSHPGAQYLIGVMHSDGEGVPKDDAKAAQWYRQAADQGYAYAQSNLGAAYYLGLGVPKVHSEAVKWLRLAAEQGLAGAQFNLAACYSTGGESTKRDLVEAYAWLGLAARELPQLAVTRETLAKGMSAEQILAGNQRESELRTLVKARLKGRPAPPQAPDWFTAD